MMINPKIKLALSRCWMDCILKNIPPLFSPLFYVIK